MSQYDQHYEKYHKHLWDIKTTQGEQAAKSAFRKLSLQLHPDQSTAADAEDVFKGLTNANDDVKAGKYRGQFWSGGARAASHAQPNRPQGGAGQQAEARARQQAEARARQQAEAKAKAEAAAKARRQEWAKQQEQLRARAKAEEAARQAKYEQAAKEKAEQAKKKVDGKAKAKPRGRVGVAMLAGVGVIGGAALLTQSGKSDHYSGAFIDKVNRQALQGSWRSRMVQSAQQNTTLGMGR